MKAISQALAYIGALLVLGADSSLGEVFVDKGGCPGEGCSYGERWVARTAVELREAPSESAAKTAVLQPGEAVDTISGEVHTCARKVRGTSRKRHIFPGR